MAPRSGLVQHLYSAIHSQELLNRRFDASRALRLKTVTFYVTADHHPAIHLLSYFLVLNILVAEVFVALIALLKVFKVLLESFNSLLSTSITSALKSLKLHR